MRSSIIQKMMLQSNGIREETDTCLCCGWNGSPFTQVHPVDCGSLTPTTPKGKASYYHCQAFHLFACQTVTSLLKVHTPPSFCKFITHFPHYRVWLDSGQRSTCKRLKIEGGSVLLQIYLVISWKTWLQGKKRVRYQKEMRKSVLDKSSSNF